MRRQFIACLCLLTVLMTLGIQPALADPPPLPALPPAAIRNQVLAATGGAKFTAVGTPLSVRSQLTSFGGVFEGAENKLAWNEAVHYINTDGTIQEMLIPLRSSGSARLDPDMTAPGLAPRPGKLIGATYQPSRGARADMYIVAVFKPEDVNCRTCVPEKVRFYYSNTRYYEFSLYHGRFTDVNGDRLLETVDEGALIAHSYSCLAVGLEQVCWAPYSFSALRQESISQNIVDSAYTDFKSIYDVEVDFYLDAAVPDLLGRNQRQTCAGQLANGTNFTNVSACVPSVVFTASKTVVAGQPIAIMVVQHAVNVRTYNTSGSFVGSLPAGEYLVMNGMPNITTPGSPTLLFLVNSDTQNHYLIPSVVQQGFAKNAVADERYPAIRDGLMGWRGVGY